jgi:ethanolamine utilization cobalamin adenosyltransferase
MSNQNPETGKRIEIVKVGKLSPSRRYLVDSGRTVELECFDKEPPSTSDSSESRPQGNGPTTQSNQK